MISMVTCTYNRATLLERTLKSITFQKHKYPWEIVIVDDGSTDNIVSVFEAYKSILPLRMVRTFREGHYSQNWPANCGVKLAKGEYILYASPEVIHYGPSFDTIHEVLSDHDVLLAANVHDLYLGDTKWLKRNTKWRKDLSCLKVFNKNRQLVGPSRNDRTGYYFLGGWRKDSFERVGGMDEGFIYSGADDKEFIGRCKYADIIPTNLHQILPSSEVTGYHQYHPRIYLTEEYSKEFLSTWKRYSEADAEQKRLHKLGHAFVPANHGKEWGQLTDNCVILE